MIAARTGIIAAGNFHPGYRAILAKGTSSGYTLPSHRVQVQQNGLYVALYNAGLITGYDIFYNFTHDGSESFSYLNWCNPNTFTLTKTGGLTFTANGGIKGNGTTGYFNTNYSILTSATTYTTSNASFLVDVKESTQALEQLFGISGSGFTDNTIFYPRSNSSDVYVMRINQTGVSLAGVSTSAAGLWYGERTTMTNVAMYKNGSLADSSTSATATNRPAGHIYIFARNVSSGSGVDLYSAKTLYCFGMGGSITSSQGTVYSAWTNYKNNL